LPNIKNLVGISQEINGIPPLMKLILKLSFQKK